MYYQSLFILMGIFLGLVTITSDLEADNESIFYNNTYTMSADTIPHPDQPKLAPGTARIQGKVLTLAKPENAKDTYEFTIKICEVSGYGPSTPPIAASDTLRIASYKTLEEVKEGKSLKAVVSYRQLMTDFEDDPPLWLLVRIEEN